MSQSDHSAASRHACLCQPEQALGLSLRHCPAVVDWRALDAWLQDKLGLVVQSPPQAMSTTDESGSSGVVWALAWRILQVAAELQRAARIPVFEPGRIRSVQQDADRPGCWVVHVSVVQLDYIPTHTTHLVYAAATRLLLGVAAAPASFTEAEPLYQQLELKVLQPLRAVMQVGKSVLPLLACAHERGIPWRHLGAGVFQLGWGANSVCMHNSKVGSDSAVGVTVVQNKAVAAQWMRRAGLPAPHNRLVSNEQEVLAAQAALAWPLVVKPADRDRGEGVVVGITNHAQLLEAFRHATTLSAQVLVERHAEGVCHRVLVVRGQVIYAVKRLPIAVCGDGRQTVSELIAAANNQQMARPSWHRAPLYPCDDLAKACLQQSGHGLATVPAAGVWAPLRPIESTGWGGLDEDYSTTLHPDNAAIACRAAALFGLDVAGVDIISPDITRPWHENGAIINEVNSAPVLGQSDSSRRTLAQVLTRLVPAQGRIRIEVCVGADQALEMAKARQHAWQAQGVAGYVTSHALTLAPSGVLMPMALQGLHARCLALLSDKHVEALVLLVQTDEVLHNGLPVDALTGVVCSGEPLAAHHQHGGSVSAEQYEQVLATLQRLVTPSA